MISPKPSCGSPAAPCQEVCPTASLELLEVAEFVALLECPVCHCRLEAHHQKVVCCGCGKQFSFARRVLELVDESTLDSQTAQELREHTDKAYGGEDYYLHHILWRKYSMLSQLVIHARVNVSRVFFGGAGYGLEVKALAKTLPFKTVYCSDLSLSVATAPAVLASTPIKLGLFTSDLQNLPIAVQDIPIITELLQTLKWCWKNGGFGV